VDLFSRPVSLLLLSNAATSLPYLSLQIYLFGDLTIYSTVVPKSMVLFIYGENAPAYAFDVFLFVFVVIIVPFW
jgi:hypothetical protein